MIKGICEVRKRCARCRFSRNLLIKTRQSLAVEPPLLIVRSGTRRVDPRPSAVCKTTMRRSEAQCPSLEGKHPLAQMIFFFLRKPEKIPSRSPCQTPPPARPSPVLKLRPSPRRPLLRRTDLLSRGFELPAPAPLSLCRAVLFSLASLPALL